MTDKVSEPESKDTTTNAGHQKAIMEAMTVLSDYPLTPENVLRVAAVNILELSEPSRLLVKLCASVGHMVLNHIARGGSLVFTDPPGKTEAVK